MLSRIVAVTTAAGIAAGAALPVSLSACGTSADGTTPTPPPDAARPADAATQPDAEAGTSFCTTHPADFCADFGGPIAGAGWDGVDARGGGIIDLVDTTETSKPKALRIRIPAIGSGANAASAVLAKRLPLSAKRKISLALAARFG